MNRQRPTRGFRDESPASSPRGALYMRVSTGRQAEHDLSIPDQRRQLTTWCHANGYTLVAEFVEAGASAADDRRPAFQQMIERACDGGQAFDFIVVHSYSRFFVAFEQEFYLRKLAKHGVRVISITQPVGDETEPVHAMMRKVIASLRPTPASITPTPIRQRMAAAIAHSKTK
jgi:site-specific DNA recombinase